MKNSITIVFIWATNWWSDNDDDDDGRVVLVRKSKMKWNDVKWEKKRLNQFVNTIIIWMNGYMCDIVITRSKHTYIYYLCWTIYIFILSIWSNSIQFKSNFSDLILKNTRIVVEREFFHLHSLFFYLLLINIA